MCVESFNFELSVTVLLINESDIEDSPSTTLIENVKLDEYFTPITLQIINDILSIILNLSRLVQNKKYFQNSCKETKRLTCLRFIANSDKIALVKQKTPVLLSID